eukprot:TRINITY_DN6626_c0_g2_i13.p1 TRINITY_DN6626_c0_g2~~TRINITY_DN6626_c0_g2_i13.p1  ORF type:complete len:649 (-),score=90.37 TRINITY_DN6626_c0_g2_i13:179-2125(-)
MLVTSRDFWPADYGNYGPFMIRQAWHCSGSYRAYDGLGGCDGARQRFDPERSWEDNTNLDKAKTLIWPVKEKYGLGLSWGDLIILTANTAIEMMGGPVLGFCAGRIDDPDGDDSILLGPTAEQNKTYPCPVNGKCTTPIGTSTIGLIYVNPEGPMGNPVPSLSALAVRNVFARMSMNDEETVALIGGGHAFGKTHGACPLGPGPSPKQDPSNPWPGNCGDGKGPNTYTSGFEGPWSPFPTRWGNYYFQNLLNNEWTVEIGPGGKHQWKHATSKHRQNTRTTMMLTSDISLLRDPQGSYQNLVRLFANNLTELDIAFSHAWYKLTTRDMGPVARCVGPWVPPPQHFQNPLPAPPTRLPDFGRVREAIRGLLFSNTSGIIQPDRDGEGNPYYGALLVHLAWQCAATYRRTDYLGGCNGARIRFPPESTWPHNVEMDSLLSLLESVQHSFVNLSWADLIVLAGTVALEDAAERWVGTHQEWDFCGGRTDASDGSGSQALQPVGEYSPTMDRMHILSDQMGLSDREFVVLSARLRSPTQVSRIGYYGSWTYNISVLSNEYFQTLLNSVWVAEEVPSSGKTVYSSDDGSEIFMLPFDLNLRWDSAYLAIAQEYASDPDLFLTEFRSAWTKLMNADRFDGPIGNLCNPSAGSMK